MKEAAFSYTSDPAGYAVVFAPGMLVALDSPGASRLAALWEIVRGEAGMSGVIDSIITEGLKSYPNLIAVEWRTPDAKPAEARLLVRGTAVMTTTDSKGHVKSFDAKGLRTWRELVVPDVAGIAFGEVTADSLLPLGSGVVMSGAVKWALAEVVAAAEEKAATSAGGATGKAPKRVAIDKVPTPASAGKESQRGAADKVAATPEPGGVSPASTSEAAKVTPTAPAESRADSTAGSSTSEADTTQVAAPIPTLSAKSKPAPKPEPAATPEPAAAAAPVSPTAPSAPVAPAPVSPAPAPAPHVETFSPPVLEVPPVAGRFASQVSPPPPAAPPAPTFTGPPGGEAPPPPDALVGGEADDQSGYDPYDQDFDQSVGRTVVGAPSAPGATSAPRQSIREVPVHPSMIPVSSAHAPKEGDHDGRTITGADLRRITAEAKAGGKGAASTEGGVRAVMCPQGHPNPPHANRCRACNTAISDSEVRTIAGLVPGVLVFSGGVREDLDGPLVIGRRPRPASGQDMVSARLVTIDSPEQGVSRSHAVVKVKDWSVTITDLGTTNGTEVTLPGSDTQRLRRGVPFTVVPGSVIRFGDEVTATYEVPK